MSNKIGMSRIIGKLRRSELNKESAKISAAGRTLYAGLASAASFAKLSPWTSA